MSAETTLAAWMREFDSVQQRLRAGGGRPGGPDGRLYAHGSTTCLVFDVPAR